MDFNTLSKEIKGYMFDSLVYRFKTINPEHFKVKLMILNIKEDVVK